MQPGTAKQTSRVVTIVNPHDNTTTSRHCFNPMEIAHIREGSLMLNGKPTKSTVIKLKNGAKYTALEQFDTVVESYNWLEPTNLAE